MILLLSLTLSGINGLTGCAPTTQSPSQVSAEKPTSDKALVIVERESQALGGGVTFNVYDNKTLAGKLGSGGKLAWLCAPGQRDIEFDDQGGGDQLGEWRIAKVGKRLAVKAGETYHFKMSYKLGVNGTILDGPGIFTIRGMTEAEMTAIAVEQEKKLKAALSQVVQGMDHFIVARMLPGQPARIVTTGGGHVVEERWEGSLAGYYYVCIFSDSKLLSWSLDPSRSESWLKQLKSQPFAVAGRRVTREYSHQIH